MHTLAPSPRSERFDVIFKQLHRQRAVSCLAPHVALDAADQALAVTVDFNERAMAVGAVHWDNYSITSGLCTRSANGKSPDGHSAIN